MITLIATIAIALTVWVWAFYDDHWGIDGFMSGLMVAVIATFVGGLVMWGLSGATHRTTITQQYPLVEVTKGSYLLTGIDDENTGTVVYAYRDGGRTLVRQRDASSVLVFNDSDTAYLVMGKEEPNHLWSLIDFNSTTEVHIPAGTSLGVGQ